MYRRLVDLFPNAALPKVETLLVLAVSVILEHHLIVVQNASLMKTVRVIKHASTKNVEIPVLDHVDLEPFVM